jgi:hypothetical protein
MGGDKNYESKDISKVHKNQYKIWKNRFKYNLKHRTRKSEEKHKVYKSKVQTIFYFDDM